MFAHKTFFRSTVTTEGALSDVQEEVRARAQAFITTELDADDIVNITESSAGGWLFPPFLFWTQFSVTVWYQKR